MIWRTIRRRRSEGVCSPLIVQSTRCSRDSSGSIFEQTLEDCKPSSRCHKTWHIASLTGIKLTIDKSGRIVVPKPLRKRLGLKPGTELEVVDQQGAVLLRAIEERPALVKIDGLWVHRGVPQAGASWDSVIEDVREERIGSVLKA